MSSAGQDNKRYLVTSALPYANGPLHFGHLAGVYIPADVYVRHHRMKKNRVLHICGSDEHGVAIMLNAHKAGKDYKEYVDEWHRSHRELFEAFDIEFDEFGQTSTEYHEQEVVKWFKALYEKDLIGTKEAEQLKCDDCGNHLPDRFVKGECYECGYTEARGDECPHCGILVEATKLKNPVCQICTSQNTHVVSVTQYYLLLSKFENEFRDWLKGRKSVWRNTVYPFVESLCKDGLQDRAISRDLEWGIDVPLDDEEAKGKKLYVWFDAPIGYVSNTKKCLEERGSGEDYLKDWWQNPNSEIVHFIGKDNVIFHCIIFPCMSMASERALPATDVPANQYLNLEGKQFSKSSGWYVDAKGAIDQFGADALRYYLLSILPETSDTSFTWGGFQGRINGELANNIGNLVSRCLKFWSKKWKEGIPSEAFRGFFDSDMAKTCRDALERQHELIESKELRKALENYMHLGQEVNTFFTEQAPWAVYKEDESRAAEIIAQTGIMIAILGVMARPFMPNLSRRICENYGDLLDDETMTALYRGEFSVLGKRLPEMVSPAGAPKILVPKIEDSVIAELEKALGKL